MGFQTTQEFFSFVLRGKIGSYENYSPTWLLKNELIKLDEALESAIDVISNSVTSYSINWASIKMIDDTFQVTIDDIENIELARDLVFNWLQLVGDPVIRAMGLNYHYEYTFDTAKEWNTVGDTLAPKALWGDFLKDPGLLAMTLYDHREDPAGYTQVDVRSGSSREEVEAGNCRIKFSVNHHFEGEGKDISDISMLFKDYVVKHKNTSKELIENTIRGCFDARD